MHTYEGVVFKGSKGCQHNAFKCEQSIIQYIDVALSIHNITE